MVLRKFAAFDNEAFTVDPSSPFLDSGSPIINNSDTPIGTIFTFTDGFPYQTIELDDTSGSPDVFEDDQEQGHVITEGRDLVADGTQVESESYHFVRQLDDDGNPFGPEIEITVFSQNGETSNIWGMASTAELVPGARYVKVDGSNRGDSLYEEFVPCFTPGAMIQTDTGLRPVESICVGDRVMTRDNGLRDVVWTGRRDLRGAELVRDSRLRPILVRAGSLAPGVPDRDMRFSPNHRLLAGAPENEMHFGEREVLVAAKHLVGRPGISCERPSPVSYVHLMFDRHEVVFADAMWSESFQPGPMALQGVGQAQADELWRLFPELRGNGQTARFAAARTILTRKEARLVRTRAA